MGFVTSIGDVHDLAVSESGRAECRPHLLAGLALTGAAAMSWAVVTGPWFETPFNQFTAIVSILPAWALPIGAWLLWRGRPSSRSAWLMFCLGVTWTIWLGTGALLARGALGASGVVVQRIGVILLRPLIFWLLLSWPTGRLARGDARGLAVLATISTIGWGAIPLLLEPELGEGNPNPVMIADLPAVAGAAGALATTPLLSLVAVLVAALMWFRYDQLPAGARHAARPALIAAVVFAAGEVILTLESFMQELTRDDSGFTLAGSLIVAIDWARFALPSIVLAVAAARTRRLAEGAERIRQIDAGRADAVERLSDAASRIFDDPMARTAFASESGWVSPEGRPVEIGGPGRDVVRIERDGEPIAALELRAGSLRRNASVGAIARAAVESADLERVEALACARRAAALTARRAIVELSDSTRYEIQRDLHDGAQQRLVGVNLRIRLAQHGGIEDPDELRAEVDDELATASNELGALVDGEFETRSRSLATALAELARCVPLPVDAEIDAPADLPDRTRAAAWFVASEATTNAVKYANASRIIFRTNVSDDRLHLLVADDGIGGAEASDGGGLAGLRDRVARLGGRLTIESPLGRGTAVTLDLPIGTTA